MPTDSKPSSIPRAVVSSLIILIVAYFVNLYAGDTSSETPVDSQSVRPDAAAGTPVDLVAPNESQTIQVQVSGIQSDQGVVRAAVFATASGFPDQANADAVGKSPANLRQGEVITVDIAVDEDYGEIAIAAYHDKNDDGQLNRGRLGKPTEAYGFSNNARATFGPPSYSDAVKKQSQNGWDFSIELK